MKRLSTQEVKRTVEAVVDAPSLSEAARRLGLSRQALYQRLRDPRVQEILSEYQTRLREELTLGVLSRAERILSVLDDLLASGSEQARLRLVLGAMQFLTRMSDGRVHQVEGEVIDDYGTHSRSSVE